MKKVERDNNSVLVNICYENECIILNN